MVSYSCAGLTLWYTWNKHEYLCRGLECLLLLRWNSCFHGCKSMKLYMRAHGDTWEDCNEALTMRHLVFGLVTMETTQPCVGGCLMLKKGGGLLGDGREADVSTYTLPCQIFSKLLRWDLKLRHPLLCFFFTLHYKDHHHPLPSLPWVSSMLCAIVTDKILSHRPLNQT